jgi:hypothetical protein
LLGASLQLLERLGVKVGAGHGELSGWSEGEQRGRGLAEDHSAALALLRACRPAGLLKG